MPRTARAAVGGYCYHARNRGNERGEVFHDAGDYHDFVRLIRQACSRVPMRVIAYCLMPNHFHLVVWPPGDEDLGAWMQPFPSAPPQSRLNHRGAETQRRQRESRKHE